MKKFAITSAIVFLALFLVSPVYVEETTLEKMPLPIPIPYFTPKEGYLWGWISEEGFWEQIKLGLPPFPQSTVLKDLPTLPKGYLWGWDKVHERWVWMKVKDGNLVIQRIKSKDKLGNWYWEEVTMSSPSKIE